MSDKFHLTAMENLMYDLTQLDVAVPDALKDKYATEVEHRKRAKNLVKAQNRHFARTTLSAAHVSEASYGEKLPATSMRDPSSVKTSSDQPANATRVHGQVPAQAAGAAAHESSGGSDITDRAQSGNSDITTSILRGGSVTNDSDEPSSESDDDREYEYPDHAEMLSAGQREGRPPKQFLIPADGAWRSGRRSTVIGPTAGGSLLERPSVKRQRSSVDFGALPSQALSLRGGSMQRSSTDSTEDGTVRRRRSLSSADFFVPFADRPAFSESAASPRVFRTSDGKVLLTERGDTTFDGQQVRQLRHHFAPSHACFSAVHHPYRAVGCVLLHVYA